MKPPRAKLLPTPLARLITVPFLIQIFLAVGLTGWFAFRNGQQAIDNILGELNEIVVKQVEIDLRTYLNSAHRINQFLISNLRTEVLSLENETELRQYFLGSSQAHPRTLGVGLGTADGEVIGIDRWPAGFEGSTSADPHVLFRAKDGTLRIWGVDEQANPVKLIETKPFDPRDRPWYQVAAQTSSPVWSEIYNTATSDELVIAASQGVYDSQNELLGVASVSIKLDEIGAIIQQLEVGKAGEIFIIERNGLLVASSNPEDKLMTKTPDGEPERILATDSKNTLIQQTAQQIEQQFDSLDAINTEVHFRAQVVDQFQSIDVIPVQVVPFADSKGLDWLVVLVISRSEFNQEIYEAVRRTIFLCAATLALATILGLLTTHLITRPIRKLVQASQNIADGDLGQTVQVSGIRELENLSHSFNEMADQLKHSFESLETQVEERTLQLKDTNLMLREEIQEHQQTEEQLKQATARANQANQAKSQFLANMSHELRTPLNAILGFAQIMNRDRSLSSEQRRNLGIINNSGQHLLGLINDILDVSKIEAGRMTLETSSFDLYQLLETLEQTFSLKVKSKGLDFRFEREADVPQFIETDEGKLRQILTNLLSNATKFTEIGEIALRVSRSFNTFNNSVNGSTVNPSPNPRPNQAHSAIGNQPTDFQFSDPIALQFAVSDTGQGISPEEQKNLFEAFVQTETGRKSQEGTGLGLTISKKFARMMGGDLTVTSAVGMGTTFYLNILATSVSDAEVAPEHSRGQVIGLAANQPEYRILIVDDVATNRQLMNALLAPIGFQLREVANGLEAIQACETWHPHLVWMDMQMPVMDGYQATQKIKERSQEHLQDQAPVIIALTANALKQQEAEILAAGCDDIVAKPFREETIFAKMAEYLQVQYLYEETVSPPTTTAPTSESLSELTSANLQIMPAEWRAELHQAAIVGNDCRMQELVEQIPIEQAQLSNSLGHLVAEFDFERIIQLTQT